MRIKNFIVLAGVMTMGVVTFAQNSAPLISNTFPPPEDIRRPDVTVTNAAKGQVSIATYSPNGRFLVTAGDDHVIRTWEARPGEQETGALIHSFAGHTNFVVAIGFGAETNSMISVSSDMTVKTWDAATGKLLRSAAIKVEGKVDSAAFCSTNPIVALAGGDQFELWNYERDELVTNLPFPFAGGILGDVIASPDKKILAIGSSRGAVALLDARTGDELGIVGVKVAGEDWAESEAFSDASFAIGCSSGDVRVWKTGDWKNAREFGQGRTNAVTALAFSAKGEQLAAGSADGAIRVWDVETGTLLCTQQGHTGAVLSLDFASNGQKMASGGADGTVRLWTVPLPPIPPADLEKIKAALPAKASAKPKQPRKLLVFWRADAILHKGGVPAANHAIEWMGKKTGAYETDFSRDYEVFDPKVLAKYDAIVMNSTAHLAIPDRAKPAYLDYVKSGHGVVGIHAAIDTFRDWPEGAKVIGATFGNHPWHPTGTWAVKLEEPDHPLLRAWQGKNFKMHDEFYEMAEPYSRADRRVLLTVDLSDPATAGVPGLRRTDKDFALSWIKRYGKGRVFYCDFGHIGEPFQNPAVLQYYLDGIQYALGDLRADDSPKKKSTGRSPQPSVLGRNINARPF